MSKKKVIYTSIVGNYDHLIQHLCVNDDYEFVCFSNDIKESRVGIWEIRKIPYSTNDSQRLSRYAKMHPHELFPTNDISIWMDANILISGPSFYEAIDFLETRKTVLLAGIKHPFRKCVYKEAAAVVRKRKELNLFKIFKEMRFIKKEGLPQNFGMYEANIIYRKHHDFVIQDQCSLWWKMINQYSRRDQLAYSYTLWKFKLPFIYIFPEKISSRNHPDLKYFSHIYNPDDTLKDRLWNRYVVKTVGRVLYRIYCILLNIER